MLSRCSGGGAGFVLRAEERREKTHQERWRPRGSPNISPARPVPPPTRPGWRRPDPEQPDAAPGPTLRRAGRRSAGPARSVGPAAARRPVPSARPGESRAARSGSGEGVTPTEAAAGRAGGTATVGEVSVFLRGKSSSHVAESAPSGCLFHRIYFKKNKKK